MAPAFPSKSFTASGPLGDVAARYRSALKKHPFLLFGLPFVALMLGGSFFLTPATAVRYEKFDRKTHMLNREEALGLRKEENEERQGNDGREEGKLQSKARKVGRNRDIREEYFRLSGRRESLDDWEPKRVERLPGEPDGTFD